MKQVLFGRPLRFLWLTVAVVASLFIAGAGSPALAEGGAMAASESSPKALTYGKFGEVPLYRGSGALETLVLILSGDDGWTSQLAALGKEVASPTVAVIGIDWPKFRAKLEAGKSKCAYPSGDLENLSRFAQAKLGFAEPKSPVLLGAREGAAIAYASHAQAPENTFSGVVSWGFCPRYKMAKSICAGDAFRSKKLRAKEYQILAPPAAHKVPGWTVVLSNLSEKSAQAKPTPKAAPCNDSAAEFVNGVPGSRLIAANDDGKTDAAKATAEDVKTAPAAENIHPGKVEALKDLPLIVVEPDEKQSKGAKPPYFAVLYSGDGGWAGFDKEIAKELNNRNVPVVGVSTLSYFWKAKSPDVAAEDLKRILTTFKAKYGTDKVLLLGYSFGADVLPSLITRLPEELQKSVLQLTMMSSSGLAEYEFHVSNWLSSDVKGQPVQPDLDKLKGKIKVQCLYGDEEKEPYCPKLDPKVYDVQKIKGGHRFDGDTPKLIDRIEGGFKK